MRNNLFPNLEVRFRYLGVRKVILGFGFTLAALSVAFFAVAIAFSATDPTETDFLNDPNFNQYVFGILLASNRSDNIALFRPYFYFRISWPWWMLFISFTMVAIGSTS